MPAIGENPCPHRLRLIDIAEVCHIAGYQNGIDLGMKGDDALCDIASPVNI